MQARIGPSTIPAKKEYEEARQDFKKDAAYPEYEPGCFLVFLRGFHFLQNVLSLVKMLVEVPAVIEFVIELVSVQIALVDMLGYGHSCCFLHACNRLFTCKRPLNYDIIISSLDFVLLGLIIAMLAPKFFVLLLYLRICR